jgi:hypothetical protein
MMKRLTSGVVAIGVIAGFSLGCAPRRTTVGPGFLGDVGAFPDLPPHIWEPLTKTFEQQARGIPLPQWKDLAQTYLAHPRIPVRVAVVDFSLDQPGGPSRSAHKEAVTGVIRDLLCANPQAPECQARVVPTRGVSATFSANDSPSGKAAAREYSFLGFRELYNSLQEVVSQWQPKMEHLVINMAVAWDPIKTAPGKTPLDDPQVQPIFHLLNRASCLGAIVIAPAGNVTGSEGPLFPAGYEIRNLPTDETCAKLSSPRREKISEDQARLVYAVGALDSLDQRMVTVRPWGQPRLAAYGLSVPAARPGRTPYIFSGTSMSAAIVSAAAAAVWSVKPDLRAEQVMTIVYEGGIRLDDGVALPRRTFDSKRGRTDFCPGHPYGPCPDPVRRVFLCGALQKVLPRATGLHCADKPSQSSFLPVFPKDLPKSVEKARQCDVTGCGYPFGPSIDQVPRGAVPQPGIAGCPGCTLSLGGRSVFGSLTWDSSSAPAMTAGVVQTWTDSSSNPQFITDPWDVTQSFWRYLEAPYDTWGAMLTISYIDPSDNTPRTKDLPLNVNWE